MAAALRLAIRCSSFGTARGARAAGTAVGGLLFVNSQGQPLDPSAAGRLWRACRADLFRDTTVVTGGRERVVKHPLGGLTMYELRHGAATTLIERVGVVEAASTMGNSPAVLMRVYLRCLGIDDTDFQAKMDDAFGPLE